MHNGRIRQLALVALAALAAASMMPSLGGSSGDRTIRPAQRSSTVVAKHHPQRTPRARHMRRSR